MTRKQITLKEIAMQDVSLVFPTTFTFYAFFSYILNGYLEIVLQRHES